MAETRALDGVRVVDLSQGIAGPYCTKLLADAGAEVIKVEPPAGDPSRRAGPFPGDVPHPEKSGRFLHLNTGKKSVTLDLGDAADRAALRRLLTGADLLVESFAPGTLHGLGLGYEDLKEEFPGLIVLSVTPFGQTGPYRDYKADAFLILALTGILYQSGDPDREPLATAGDPADYFAGLCAWIAALAALVHRERGGGGQHIDTSIWESMGAADDYVTGLYAFMGAIRRRFYSRQPMLYPGDLFPCRDGHIIVSGGTTGFPTGMALLLEQPELMEHPLFNDAWARVFRWREFDALLTPWFMAHDWQDILQKAQDLRMLFAPCLSPKDLLENAHLRERRFFQEIDHPIAGKLPYPGPPFRMSATPLRITRAPRLGEHTAEVLGAGGGRPGLAGGWTAWPRRRLGGGPSAGAGPRPHPTPLPAGEGIAVPPQQPSSVVGRPSSSHPSPITHRSSLPLAGLRVLDFSHVYAGPTCTRLLVDLGAEVWKVEGFTRLDTARGGYAAENDPSGDYWNRGFYYLPRNLGKKSLAIDLTRPEALALVKRLVPLCDVVVETYTPRVMRHFGMDYPKLRALKEDLIMISMSGYGQDGPWSNYGALGYGLEAASGIAWLNGYPGGPPIRSCIPFNDPLSGLVGAGAVLTALFHRRRTGEGQYIDLSEHETAIPLVGEALLEYAMNGRLPERLGNGRRGIAPHGCYPCRGRDNWLAIACRTDAEWRALCRATGHPEWAADPRFADAPSRYAHRAALDRLITGWTADQDHLGAMHRLQAAGVPATAVLNGKEVLFDPHLRARGYFAWIEHPGVGGRPFPRYLGSRFSAFDTATRARAPRLGEHNAEILAHLGLSETEVRRLEADKILGTQPEVADPALAQRLNQSRQWPLEALRDQGSLRDIEPDYREQLMAISCSLVTEEPDRSRTPATGYPLTANSQPERTRP